MWIIVGWYNEDWWSKPDVECKGEELLEAAANMIETLPLPLSTSQQPTISDRVIYHLQVNNICEPFIIAAGKDQPRKIKITNIY